MGCYDHFCASYFTHTLQTSTKPPRSLTNVYKRYKSNGCLDIVGHAVIGVRASSIKLSNLSKNGRRSGLSSISYNLHKLSDFCCRARKENNGTEFINDNLLKWKKQVENDFFIVRTFPPVDRCGVDSVWLLKTGLAGVRGHVGDPISKSSCIVGVLPADAKWLWLYTSTFRFGVEHCGSDGSDAERERERKYAVIILLLQLKTVQKEKNKCLPAEAFEIVLCWLASSIVVPSGPVVIIDVTGCCDDADEPDEMPLSCDSGSGIPSIRTKRKNVHFILLDNFFFQILTTLMSISGLWIMMWWIWWTHTARWYLL